MSGANIVATVDAKFENKQDLSATLSTKDVLSAKVSDVDNTLNTSVNSNPLLSAKVANNQNISVNLGSVFGGSCKVLYNTTAYWNSMPDLIAKKGYIYCYSDYMQDDGKNIAGLKVGDGLAYLIDMPFLDKIYADHIDDVVRHITAEEREFWNNKVRCYIDPDNTEHLIFTTE